MKKIALLTLLVGLCMTTLTANAQYSKGDITGNAGLSLIPYGYGLGFSSSTFGFLPLTVNVEYSLDDRFAVGPYLGFYARYSAFSFGGRGTFHATSSLNDWFNWSIDDDKWDLYASAILGFESYSYRYYTFDGFNRREYGDRRGGIDFGPIIGGRYFFNPNFGVFAETGAGSMGAFTVGASLKF